MLENLIVPVLNRYDLLDRMIGSIDYPIRDLLVIDNGGELMSLQSGSFVHNLHILNMPSNLGVAASWNLGIKLFPHDQRWFFSSNDMAYGPGALERLSEARRDEITLSDMFPYWHTFCVGDEALSKVGLFDEALYPAFFEDTDAERRARHFDVPIRSLPIPTLHDNSSTIKSDQRLQARNNATFGNNSAYYAQKIANNDYGPGGWSLERRRMNAWDTPR
jgi:GT2 family glycosyltransferase